MAYFSNGSEGDILQEQCASCRFGQEPCPIALAQMEYNYDQHNDKTGTARKILNTIVSEEGICTMKEMAGDYFNIDHDPNQLSLF